MSPPFAAAHSNGSQVKTSKPPSPQHAVAGALPNSAAPTPVAADHRLFVWALCAGLLGTALAVDPFADAAFDAPKRLMALLAAAAAVVSLIFQPTNTAPRRWSRPALTIVSLAALAALGLLVASWQADDASASTWSSLRVAALFALYLLFGAAPALNGEHGSGLLRVATLAVAVNALMSLLQAAGVAFPLPIAQLGGRFPTGALLGNEGYVALACALVAAAMLPMLLFKEGSRWRLSAGVIFVLCVAAIVVNRQLTSMIALGVAAVVVIAVRLRRQRWVWLGAGLLACVLAAALVPTLRDASWARLPISLQTYQERSTYRLGGWVAAIEMVRTRPLLGHGPGSYAIAAQAYRQQAELRLRVLLTPPPSANAFVFAHQDYLQLAAEAGVPTLVAVLAALLALINGLLRMTRKAVHLEATMLLGMISAGAIAALAWFPLQIPFTAVLLLLACGRAWRLIADDQEQMT